MLLKRPFLALFLDKEKASSRFEYSSLTGYKTGTNGTKEERNRKQSTFAHRQKNRLFRIFRATEKANYTKVSDSGSPWMSPFWFSIISFHELIFEFEFWIFLSFLIFGRKLGILISKWDPDFVKKFSLLTKRISHQLFMTNFQFEIQILVYLSSTTLWRVFSNNFAGLERPTRVWIVSESTPHQSDFWRFSLQFWILSILIPDSGAKFTMLNKTFF